MGPAALGNLLPTLPEKSSTSVSVRGIDAVEPVIDKASAKTALVFPKLEEGDSQGKSQKLLCLEQGPQSDGGNEPESRVSDEGIVWIHSHLLRCGVQSTAESLRIRSGMAKKRKVWTEWWEWELEITDHTYDYMPVREFTEFDLRRMIELATDFHPDIEEGRWRIETQFNGKPWEVIVEPTPEKKLLVVVTAYDVN